MAGYPSKQEKIIIDAAERLMIETMARYDPSHDAYHVQRVRKTALALARALPEEPRVDLLVVEIAALLHDVLDKKYVTAAQSSDAYAFFLPFFQSTIPPQQAFTNGGDVVDLIADGRAALITRIIENVSWTTEKKLRATEGGWTEWHETCRELHCVQDADRLDAIGAFGILRCAAYSTVMNRPLHTPPVDPALPDSALQHFHDKLVHIRGRLKTATGRKMGEKRHQVLLDFLDSIDEEYSAQPEVVDA